MKAYHKILIVLLLALTTSIEALAIDLVCIAKINHETSNSQEDYKYLSLRILNYDSDNTARNRRIELIEHNLIAEPYLIIANNQVFNLGQIKVVSSHVIKLSQTVGLRNYFDGQGLRLIMTKNSDSYIDVNSLTVNISQGQSSQKISGNQCLHAVR